MGIKNVYERFVWFENQVKAKKDPTATSLSKAEAGKTGKIY